jgi:subtilisin family serine protease
MAQLASLGPAYERELRFIIQLKGDNGQLPAIAKNLLGDDTVTKPLFPQAKEKRCVAGMPNFFVVRKVGLSFRDLNQNPYDLAATIRASDESLLQVTPDLPRRPMLGAQPFLDVCALDGQVGPGKWVPRAIRLENAWDRLRAAHAGRGQGVFIGHLDTGIRSQKHIAIDQSRIDRARCFNVFTGSTNTDDPLNVGFLLNPGHGTETAAVAWGNDLESSTGVAPDATLVDVRCTDSVVLFFNSDIARAIWHATQVECDVITMSLGGTPEIATDIALMNARQANRIVVSAAGNCVPFVTFPASSVFSMAIAASNSDSQPWANAIGGPGSSFGPKVDVSAPGQDVLIPYFRQDPPDDLPDTQFGPGRGTSFAVAVVAGTAALWIAYRRAKSLEVSPALFQSLLKSTVTTDSDWDTGAFGTGIINVDSLLAKSDAAPEGRFDAMCEPQPRPIAWLAGVLGSTEASVEPILHMLFNRPQSDLGADTIPLVTEFVHQLTDRPAVARRLHHAVIRNKLDEKLLGKILSPAFDDQNTTTRLSDFFRHHSRLPFKKGRA